MIGGQAAGKTWKQNLRPMAAVQVAHMHRRHAELKARQERGEITGLDDHIHFPLIVNDVHLGEYEASFIYFQDGKRIAESVGALETEAFTLRAQLMRALYQITVRIT